MNFSNLVRNAGHNVARNSPAILMGLSIAGVVTTAWLMHKATKKSEPVLAAAISESTEPLTVKQKISLSWKYYLPPILSCGATVAFIVAGNTLHFRRSAALITAVALGETALSDYKEQISETFGKGKARKAADELIQKQVTQAETDGKLEKLVVFPENQEQYVFETHTQRMLVSTVEKINAAANKVARDCINNDHATLNQFYSEIGLDPVPWGDDVGWSNTLPLEVDLGSAIVKDGKGVIAIKYQNPPTSDFMDPWR